VPGCQHESKISKLHPLALLADVGGTVEKWHGWDYHVFFGLQNTQYSFSSPTRHVYATWTVPPLPSSTTGQQGNPWNVTPTMSFWPAVNGVNQTLQPVMEFNGVLSNQYDIVSFNCCPAGVLTHGPAVPVQPGDRIESSVTREGNSSMFGIFTYLKGKGDPCSPSTCSYLRAEMVKDMGYASFNTETYAVSKCDELMPPIIFNSSHVALMNGTEFGGCDLMNAMHPIYIPWAGNGVNVPRVTPCNSTIKCSSGDVVIALNGQSKNVHQMDL